MEKGERLYLEGEASLWVDVWAFDELAQKARRLAAAGALAGAVSCWEGGISLYDSEGLLPDSDFLPDVVEVMREELRQQWLAGLRFLARYYAGQTGEEGRERAIDYWQRLYTGEPRDGDNHYIFYGYSGTSKIILRLQFRYYNAKYQIKAGLLSDGSTWTSSSWLAITDAPHAIEFDWRAATGVGANNGGLTLWIDGAQRANLTGIDNDTLRFDQLRLGAVVGVDTGTRGTYYFDAFDSRRQSYIGPIPSDGASTYENGPIGVPARVAAPPEESASDVGVGADEEVIPVDPPSGFALAVPPALESQDGSSPQGELLISLENIVSDKLMGVEGALLTVTFAIAAPEVMVATVVDFGASGAWVADADGSTYPMPATRGSVLISPSLSPDAP